MDLKLHANATTTPRTRAYIRQSRASISGLARELGIHSRTVARWKARADTSDRSTRPHRLATTISDWEEALIVELRRSLALPLDDIVEAMRLCLNPKLSRSGIHRCLKRHGLSARLNQQPASAAFQADTQPGFIHIEIKHLPPLHRQRRYAYVAIERATRFVYLEILPERRADTAAGFLTRFLDRFPLIVHTILTDNGSEFTDLFSADSLSGQHPFDRICAAHAITHRLSQPSRPQTDGMVGRLNRRVGEYLGPVPQNRAAHQRRFHDHAERDAYLHGFVADYNRTRLRCLDDQAPAELFAKLMGHNRRGGAAPIHPQDADGREATSSSSVAALPRRDESLRKVLAIGEIDINSETLAALAKGLDAARNRYIANRGLRTIPLNKKFADTLSGLAARCLWIVETFESLSLSSALQEYDIDVEKAKALLCQLHQAADDMRSRVMGIGLKPEEAASDARSLMMGSWVDPVETKDGSTNITSRFKHVIPSIIFTKSLETKKGNIEKPETALFRDLRQLFISLGGTEVIGRGGPRSSSPLYKFEMACAKLTDRGVPFPNEKKFREVLRKALQRDVDLS
jgi:hypothetical protein